MFEFDEKYLFPVVDNGADEKPDCPLDTECDCGFPHPKSSFTTNEEIERTAKEMREMISRLLEFKKRTENRCAELMRNLTADNVLFKDNFSKLYQEFIENWKNDYCIFKSSINNSMELFGDEFEGLRASCETQIREYYNEFCDVVEQHKETIGISTQEAYDTFKKQIDKLLENHQRNIFAHIESVILDKVDEGVITLTYKPDLCTSPEDFGALGDGEQDDTAYVQYAIDNAGTVVLHPGKTYRISGTITLHSNIVFNGNGSVLEFVHTDSKVCIDASACENVRIFDLDIVNHSKGFGIVTNEGKSDYSVNICLQNVSYEPIHHNISKGMFFGNVKDLTVENCYFLCENDDLPDEMSSAIIVWSEQDVDTNSKYINIRNNHIVGFYRGVHSYGTGKGSAGNRQVMTVEGNIIEKTKNEAIYCYHCPGAKILNNFILGCEKGIFADSSSDTDKDGVIISNMKTNLVSGNTINTATVGIYTEELTSGIISENNIYNCSVAGLIIGGGSNHIKVCNNNFDSCYDGVVLDMGYTANHYTIVMPEIVNNTFVLTGRHCVFSKNCDSVMIKNNLFRLWGMQGGDNFASAFRNEGACGYKYIIGNEFNNRVIDTKTESKGSPFACISDVSEESYADVHICDNSFINALATHDINIVNYSARRYFMNNRFDSTPVVSIRTGYENTFIHSNNNGIADNSK